MAIATGTALLLSAGASLISGSMQSNAISSSTQTQIEAQQQALDELKTNLDAAVASGNDKLAETLQSYIGYIERGAEAQTGAIQDITGRNVETAQQIGQGNVNAINEMANINKKAVTEAADTTAAGYDAAKERLTQQKADVTKNFASYRALGETAATSLNDYLSGKKSLKDVLEADPGYQFQLEQGSRALDRSLVGSRLSGRAAKEAMRFGQGLASTTSENVLSRLERVAGQGQGATATEAGLTTGLTGSLANLDINQAQALADKITALGGINANTVAQLNDNEKQMLTTITQAYNQGDAAAADILARLNQSKANVTGQIGQQQAQNVLNAGTALANATAGAATNIGNIQANATMAQSENISNTLSNLASLGLYAAQPTAAPTGVNYGNIPGITQLPQDQTTNVLSYG